MKLTFIELRQPTLPRLRGELPKSNRFRVLAGFWSRKSQSQAEALARAARKAAQ